MRDPAQHPSRRQLPTAVRGLDLDLGLPVPGPKGPPGVGSDAGVEPPQDEIAVPELLELGPSAGATIGRAVSEAESPGAGLAPSFDGDLLEVGLVEDPVVGPSAASAEGRPASRAELDVASEDGMAAEELRPATIEVDSYDVQLLAAYGPAPSSLPAAVGYAWRVIGRRRQLRVMYEEKRQTHEQLSHDTQREIAGIVDGLRALMGEADQSQELFAEIIRFESLVRDRSAQLHATADAFSQQNAALDKDLNLRGADRQRLEEQLQTLQIRYEARVQEQRKVAAAVKRLKQQLQSQQEKARDEAAEGAQFATPEHAQQLVAIQAELKGCAEELVQHDNLVREARDEVRIQQRAIAEIGRRIDAIVARRRGLSEEAGRTEALHSEGVKRAQQQRMDACERMFWSALGTRPELFDDEQQAYVTTLDESRQRSAQELECHRLAIDAYDGEAYRRGLAIAVTSIVVVVTLLFVFVRLV